MRNTKFRAYISMLAALLLLCGCGENGDSEIKETNSSNFNIEEQLLFEISDWSFDEVVNSIYVDNINLPFPCSINELPKEFSVSDNILYYASDSIGTVEMNDEQIITYSFNCDAAEQHNIIVDKINPNDTVDDVISYYGESNDVWSVNSGITTMQIYRFYNGALIIGNFDDTANYDTITVTYRIYEDEYASE